MEFRWSKQTKVNSEDGPSARCWHTFTAVGDTIYLFGGLGPEGPKNDVYKLSQSWGEFQWSKVETKGEVPSPRFRHTASAVGDDIFIIGGFTGPKTRLNDVWKLNVSTGEWTCTIPDSGPEGKASKNVPAPRGSHTADVVGTDIYVFGGYGGYGFCLIELGDMFVLDTTAMSWRTVTAKGMPSARSGHASCVHKGRIAIYGGLSSTGACEGVNWFDCEESSWKQTSIPGKGYPRYNHALLPVKGQFNSKIVAVMGSEPSTDDENARGVFSSRISVLDVGAHGMWANGEDASEEKTVTRSKTPVAFDARKNRAVLFGGFDGSWLSDVLVLDISSSKSSKDMLEEYELSQKEQESVARRLQSVTHVQAISEAKGDAEAKQAEENDAEGAEIVESCAGVNDVLSALFIGENRIFKLANTPNSDMEAATQLFGRVYDNITGLQAMTSSDAISLAQGAKTFQALDKSGTGDVQFEQVVQLLFSDTLFKWSFADNDYGLVMEGFMAAAEASVQQDGEDDMDMDRDEEASVDPDEGTEKMGGEDGGDENKDDANGGANKDAGDDDGEAKEASNKSTTEPPNASDDSGESAKSASNSVGFLRFMEIYQAATALARADPSWSGQFTVENLVQVAQDLLQERVIHGISSAAEDPSEDNVVASIWSIVKSVVQVLQAPPDAPVSTGTSQSAQAIEDAFKDAQKQRQSAEQEAKQIMEENKKRAEEAEKEAKKATETEAEAEEEKANNDDNIDENKKEEVQQEGNDDAPADSNTKDDNTTEAKTEESGDDAKKTEEEASDEKAAASAADEKGDETTPAEGENEKANTSEGEKPAEGNTEAGDKADEKQGEQGEQGENAASTNADGGGEEGAKDGNDAGEEKVENNDKAGQEENTAAAKDDQPAQDEDAKAGETTASVNEEKKEEGGDESDKGAEGDAEQKVEDGEATVASTDDKGNAEEAKEVKKDNEEPAKTSDDGATAAAGSDADGGNEAKEE